MERIDSKQCMEMKKVFNELTRRLSTAEERISNLENRMIKLNKK